MPIDPGADLNNNIIRYIPFYFDGDKDLFTFLDNSNTNAEISLGNGIKNLITFYNLAKNKLMAEKLNETGTNVGKIKKALTDNVTDANSLKGILQISHEMATDGDGPGANIFSPYKVEIKVDGGGFQQLTKEHIKGDEIGGDKTFKTITQIIPTVVFGGKTRKGGRKHKRKQRKSAKRKSSRKRKTM